MSKSAIGDVPDSDYAGLADRIASSERHIAELEALVRSLRAELHDIVSLALVSHTKKFASDEELHRPVFSRLASFVGRHWMGVAGVEVFKWVVALAVGAVLLYAWNKGLLK